MIAPAVGLLDRLFHPQSIAIVGAGASPESMGSRLLRNVVGYGYPGRIYAVNRDGEACGDVPGYRRVLDLPETVDVCFIAVAAKNASTILEDCAARGVPLAQIFSSTYGEPGNPNAALLQAARGVTRLIGPNCLGTHSPSGGITYVPDPERRSGSVAIVSQSGGLTTDVIHQAHVRGLYLSKAVSIGDCIDLGPADFLAYLAEDDETGAIGFYLEGTKDQRLAGLLRKIAPHKPIVIVKGGRTIEGAASAVSHTGALAGDYATWQAAIKQAGAIAVDDVDELLATLTGLQRGIDRPRGNRVAMIGNGGGITVLTTDVLVEEGMTSASLGGETVAKIGELGLPPGSSLGSALDVPANALIRMRPESVRSLFGTMIADPGVDLMIAHLNLIAFALYQGDALTSLLAKTLATLERDGKPVYVALRASPEPRIEDHRRMILAACAKAGLPCFTEAIEAARVAARIRKREELLAALVQSTVAPVFDARSEASCRALFDSVRRTRRTLLSQAEAFAFLDALDIAHPPLALAKNAEEAGSAAEAMGFPVALKIDSPDIVHKTEIGGVRLHLGSKREVSEAFEDVVAGARRTNRNARIEGVLVQRMVDFPVVEAIVGIKRDPQFGPVVLVGTGGILVELLHDVALRVAPITTTEARAMWRELHTRRLFEGFRGAKPADTSALETTVVRLALAAAMFPEIAELDVNPLFIYDRGTTAVDCRVRLSYQ